MPIWQPAVVNFSSNSQYCQNEIITNPNTLFNDVRGPSRSLWARRAGGLPQVIVGLARQAGFEVHIRQANSQLLENVFRSANAYEHTIYEAFLLVTSHIVGISNPFANAL